MNIWLKQILLYENIMHCISMCNIRWMKQRLENSGYSRSVEPFLHSPLAQLRQGQKGNFSTAKMVLLLHTPTYQLILLHYTISMPASHCYSVNEFQCPLIALKGDDSTNLPAPVSCTTNIHGDP